MANQQIIDYIKRQLQQGIPREQIRSALVAAGWQVQEVEEAFNLTDVPVPPTTVSSVPTSPASSSKVGKFVLWLVVLLILAGGAYFVVRALSNIQLSGGTVVSESSKTAILPQPASQTQAQQQNPEVVFADMLSACTKYKMSFQHPLTGGTLEKEVLGVVNGKCGYVEQMPNGGKLQCRYSESERMAVAQYYKDVALAESVGASVSANLGSGDQKTTYTIDGKVVDNPLQESMNIGVCTITGY